MLDAPVRIFCSFPFSSLHELKLYLEKPVGLTWSLCILQEQEQLPGKAFLDLWNLVHYLQKLLSEL